MYLGIIIVFNNDEENLNVPKMVDLFNTLNLKICLVNNGSLDKTIDILQRIKYQLNTDSDFFIVDNKFDKGIKNAVKSGVRFLLNENEFDFIVYLKSNSIGQLNKLKKKILDLKNNYQHTLVSKNPKRSVLKNVYSIQDFI